MGKIPPLYAGTLTSFNIIMRNYLQGKARGERDKYSRTNVRGKLLVKRSSKFWLHSQFSLVAEYVELQVHPKWRFTAINKENGSSLVCLCIWPVFTCSGLEGATDRQGKKRYKQKHSTLGKQNVSGDANMIRIRLNHIEPHLSTCSLLCASVPRCL